MSKLLLIENGSGAREIALTEGKRLLYYVREAPGALEAEQVYLGVTDRIAKGMEACFVRLDGEQTGFLPFSECRDKPRSGERIIVQVKKPPVGGKAPYLTQDISLAGRYAILTPRADRHAVSRRVTDEEDRAKLLALAKRLGCPCGLVLRYESLGASEQEISAEVAALSQKWERIREKADSLSSPGLLEGRMDALSRLLRDEHGQIEKALTDDPAALPPLPFPAEACPHPFDLLNIRAKMEKSMQRKVWLDCGGYLVIDRTEAMTVIDVNSGKFTGGREGAESAFLRLNKEAAEEIARLMRLRNLGGIVIVDFVDMQSDESRAQITKALEAALADDPVKTVIHGFTSLGLMELTRKKTEESQ